MSHLCIFTLIVIVDGYGYYLKQPGSIFLCFVMLCIGWQSSQHYLVVELDKDGYYCLVLG